MFILRDFIFSLKIKKPDKPCIKNFFLIQSVVSKMIN